MPTAVAISKLGVKPLNSPDEVRTPNKTRVEIVRLEGFTLGRFSFEPGWRWSECVKPVVKTDTCEVSHLGYVVSGRITIQMNDGTKRTISAGDSYAIPPGHDAWVEGNESFIAIEVMSAEQYAKGKAA
jgi:quercetin dioxygenase-like cupin family protein